MTTWYLAPATGRCHAGSPDHPERTCCGARIGAQWQPVTPEAAARGDQCPRCLQAVAPAPVVSPVVSPPPPAEVTWFVLAGTAPLAGSVLHQRDPQHPHRMRCRRLVRALRPAVPEEIATLPRCPLCRQATQEQARAIAARQARAATLGLTRKGQRRR